MMKSLWLSAGLAVLAGCTTLMDPPPTPEQQALEKADPIVVRVTGYGTYQNVKDRMNARKRLLAMRASKLDAYRALAERIYGTVIYGNSTVEDLVLKEDRFKTFVDSVIRGARVVSVSELKSGGFETVLEVVLEPKFRLCLTNVNYFRYTEECRMPLPHGDPQVSLSSGGTGAGGQHYYIDKE
ncbi:MAG: hypothetical protein D6758_01105 [Gammaproteobacteria bacterium]|nr:MAG: hypothetical protein D6758_01105 [Gammaproteobacteria bacterium]